VLGDGVGKRRRAYMASIRDILAAEAEITLATATSAIKRVQASLPPLFPSSLLPFLSFLPSLIPPEWPFSLSKRRTGAPENRNVNSTTRNADKSRPAVVARNDGRVAGGVTDPLKKKLFVQAVAVYRKVIGYRTSRGRDMHNEHRR